MLMLNSFFQVFQIMKCSNISCNIKTYAAILKQKINLIKSTQFISEES